LEDVVIRILCRLACTAGVVLLAGAGALQQFSVAAQLQ
jgi:hypothetical protein